MCFDTIFFSNCFVFLYKSVRYTLSSLLLVVIFLGNIDFSLDRIINQRELAWAISKTKK